MIWIEDLPEECPPSNAIEPNNFIVYRLAENPIIDEQDFKSHRQLKPKKIFDGVDECIVRSLSVYNEINKCWNMLKLPAYKKRWKAVLKITLEKDDGLVLQTFKDPNHYSWWRTTNFILEKSVVLTDNE